MTTTRKLCYQVATSLDGYIAGAQGEADWIVMDPDIDFGALFARFDALLMGRRSFEAMLGMHAGAGGYGMKTYVASRTLDAAKHPEVTVIGDDLEQRVRELKAEPGKDIWLFGGGSLFASLLDAGLVDVVELAIIPALLGRGIPLLAPTSARHSLALRKHQVFPKTGTALMTYEPVAPTAPRRSRGKRAAHNG